MGGGPYLSMYPPSSLPVSSAKIAGSFLLATPVYWLTWLSQWLM